MPQPRFMLLHLDEKPEAEIIKFPCDFKPRPFYDGGKINKEGTVVRFFGILIVLTGLAALMPWACGSNNSPSSPAATATPVPPTATYTTCLSCTPTNTPTNTPSSTPTSTATISPTTTPTLTATLTITSTPTNTATIS